MIKTALRDLGWSPDGCTITAVHGGDIHQASRVEVPGRAPLFIKCNRQPLPDIFAKEARGLKALRDACEQDGGLIRVPEVVAFSDHYLALQWIERAAAQPETGRVLGEGLAALHHHSAPAYGWEESNWIGSLVQDNELVDASQGPGAFFASQRLAKQADLGAARLPASLLRRLERLCERIDTAVPPSQERPALLHGDLWGGNWCSDASGGPWIFDPAVHYGCREAELAFTTLFGGFPTVFYEAYETLFPLEPDWRDRIDLWNVYPLLVHANLFGGGYAASAEAIVARYVG